MQYKILVMKYIFFRNDDVRNSLDKSLIEVTDLFVQNQIPISHAVEPANVTPEVFEWLKEKKKNYPNLIEIIQHGYRHKLNVEVNIGGKLRKGEFGGTRSYKEQYEDILAGRQLMDRYFKDQWFSAFTFPFGARNKAAIKAISDCDYKVVNGSMGTTWDYNLLYFAGRLLKKEMLFKRKISWNLKFKPGTNIFQIDTSISIIKKFLDDNESAEFYSLDELKKKTILYLRKKNNVGFVLHHRYHNEPYKLQLVEDFLKWLKSMKGIEFSSIEGIYNRFAIK